MEPEAPRGLRLPIDYFFRSLAADQRERAVCIVLSGTGSDGTLGLRAIKGEGGMAIAQSPESAGYDGMPRSAIGTGLVDYVLAPAEMPEQLLGYVGRAFGREPRPARAAASGRPDQLLEVLHLLRDRSGHDFTHYKTNTLRRRVERRMAVTRIERMDDYLALLRRDALEAETLFRELLIGVTNFFRDAPAFEALAAEALAPLVAARRPGGPAARVGAGLLHWRGGLLDRHAPAGADRCRQAQRARPGLRHRHRRRGHRARTRRRVPRRASAPTCHRSGSRASSCRTATPTGWPSPCATAWCSPSRTSPRTRRSREST